MSYIETPVKNNIKDASNTARIKAAKDLSTGRLVFILLDRHKVPLLIAGNVVLVLNWAVPMWFQMVLSLFQG